MTPSLASHFIHFVDRRTKAGTITAIAVARWLNNNDPEGFGSLADDGAFLDIDFSDGSSVRIRLSDQAIINSTTNH